jgi:hypothetical protein
VQKCLLLLLFPVSFYAQGYFQQRVDYKISVTLNDRDHKLRAFEEITYHNHSEDTLTFIYMHLWPNAYRDNTSALAAQFLQQGRRDLYFAKAEDRGFIDSLDFRTGNTPLRCEWDKQNPDICKLILPRALEPGENVVITTPFRVKVPKAIFSRMGHDGDAYYISQWYPKPAVYDADGWHPMPYLDQGEFYSEYGSYDVSITLPENYVLASTGERFDADEEEASLRENVLRTEKIIRQLDSVPYKKNMAFPPSAKEFKTIRFRQDNVHDFAWFADKRFHVLRGEVVLPHTKRSVQTWAYFTDDQIELWKDAIGYISDATFYYSLWNGDYLYNSVSAVDGVISAGGGMEYPMVTVIGRTTEAFNLDVVITHEVGHNWFYGMLGTNEREHAWMDEGINSFNEMRYVRTKYPKASLADIIGRDSTFSLLDLNKFRHDQSYYLLYAMQAKRGLDQACELPSDEFTSLNYGAIVYSKTALLFNYLMNYMGESDFDVAMQFYFEQCKLKHPSPSDLRRVLEYFSEKKLDWFFDDLVGTTKKLDYRIVRYRKEAEDGTYLVEVHNKGEIKGPVALCGTRDGKIVGMVWYDGFEGSKVLEFPPAEIDAFKIDYFEFMPEANRSNNTLRTRGLFRKCEPLQVKLVAALDNPSKTQAFLAPAAAYNLYNGLMLGAAYYNHAIFEKNLETELVPMYAFGDKGITGLANVHLNLHPKKLLQHLSFDVKAARFAYGQDVYTNYYNRVAPGLTFELKPKAASSPLSHRMGYRYVQVFRQFTDYVATDTALTAYAPVQADLAYGVHDLLYQFTKSTALYPFTARLNLQAGTDVQKITLSLVQKIYINSTKYLELRLFGGNIFYMRTGGAGAIDYRLRMTGWRGYNDYLYDYSYFGRSETYGLAANQFTETDGAFKAYSALGQTTKWLVAMNVKSPKFARLPLLLYADAGACASDGFGAGQDPFMYNAGLDIVIGRDFCEIFVPLLLSKNMQDNNTLNGIDFIHQVRFTFNLHRANPFGILRQAVDF